MMLKIFITFLVISSLVHQLCSIPMEFRNTILNRLGLDEASRSNVAATDGQFRKLNFELI